MASTAPENSLLQENQVDKNIASIATRNSLLQEEQVDKNIASIALENSLFQDNHVDKTMASKDFRLLQDQVSKTLVIPAPLQAVSIKHASTSESENTYETVSAKNALHGIVFQLKLLMLFFHRASRVCKKNKWSSFKLATEMKGVGKFDDVVFRYETVKGQVFYRALQAKHSLDEKKSITEHLLVQAKGDFSLWQYFESYLEIRDNSIFNNGTWTELTLCTNIGLGRITSTDLSGCICVNGKFYFEEKTEEDHILTMRDSNGHVIGKQYRFVQLNGEGNFEKRKEMFWKNFNELKKLFQKCLEVEQKSTKSKKVEEKVASNNPKSLINNVLQKPLVANKFNSRKVSENEIKEFMRLCVFAVNQPNEKQLFDLIANELGNEFKYSSPSFLVNDLLGEITDWSKENLGRFLTKKEANKIYESFKLKISQFQVPGNSSIYCKNLESSGIRFKTKNKILVKLTNFLNYEKNQLFNLICPEEQNIKLSAIKVWQVLYGKAEFQKKDSFIMETLDNLLCLKNSILAAFRSDSNTLLIVIDASMPISKNNEQNLELFVKELSQVIKQNYKKKILVISKQNNKHCNIVQKFTTECRVEWDISSFEDLTEKSQFTILDHSVCFQGYTMSLQDLLGGKLAILDQEITKLIDVTVLSQFVNCLPLEIDRPISVSNSYEKSFYIERTLLQKIILKRECYNYKLESMNLLNKIENFDSDKVNQNTSPLKETHYECSSKQVFQSLSKILISDMAGMGKTTLLTHLSLWAKQQNPTDWVVRINLNDHVENLKTQKQNEIVPFITQQLLKLKTTFEHKLFEYMLTNKEPRIVLMLDGFDEISPKYETTVLQFIEKLNQYLFKHMLITTRPYKQKLLENHFTQFAFSIKPFSKENQVDFLIRFWSKTKKIDAANWKQLEKFANNLIDKLEKSLSYNENLLMGIPLQCRMLAEYFSGPNQLSSDLLPEQLNLIDLYQLFVNRKYEIYSVEKNKIPLTQGGMEQMERDKNVFLQQIQFLALGIIMIEKDIQSLGLELDIKRVENIVFARREEYSRIGIFQVLGKKIQFIHQTFAEYLVAKYVFEQLCDDNSIFLQNPSVIFNSFLTDDRYIGVRAFINSFIKKSKPLRNVIPFKICLKCGNFLNKTRINNENSSGFIDNLIKEENICIIEFVIFLLETLEITIENFYDSKFEHTKYKINSDLNKTTKFLFEKTIIFSKTPSQDYKVNNLNLDMLNVIWKWLTKTNFSLTKFMFNSWIYTRDNVLVLRQLWEWSSEANVDKKDLLFVQDNNQDTAWHWAAYNGHVEVMKQLWEWSSEANVYKKDLLFDRGNNQNIAWHLASWNGRVEVMKQLWKWSSEVNVDKKNLLFNRSDYQMTAWHCAAWNGHVEVIKQLWEWSSEANLDKKALLFNRTDYQITAWHCAAGNGHVEVIQQLWEWSSEANLDKKDLLFFRNSQQNTAWHCAAENGHLEVMKLLWEWSNEANVNKKDLLFVRGNNQDTAWHWAAYNGHVEVMKQLWMWSSEVKVDKKYLFFVQRNEQTTALHCPLRTGHVQVLKQFWEQISEANVDKKGQNFIRNNIQNTAWHIAALKGHVEVMKQLWVWSSEANVVKKDLLFVLTDAQNTVWHCAAANGYLEVMKQLWEWSKEANVDKKNLFFARGNNQNTAWHCAALNGHVEVMKQLWEWGSEANVDRKDILFLENAEKDTALHLAAFKDHSKVIKQLIVWIVDDTVNLNKLLFSKNASGKTALPVVANNNHHQIMNYF